MPSGLGYAVTRRLAARPRRVAVSRIESAALQAASPGRVGTSGRIPVQTWGEGPSVLLVHGWGGRAAQMAPLGAQLGRSGFRAIALDVAGHGESPVKEARWEWFIRDVAEVAEHTGSLHALVGHSAGALAMMAARRVRGLKAARYVCISAPHHPYPPLDAIRRRLNPGGAVLDRYRRFLAQQFECDWEELETGVAWRGAAHDLLLCYDTTDRYIDPADGGRINELCPGSKLLRTTEFGHTKLLAADVVANAIEEFLRSPKQAQTTTK